MKRIFIALILLGVLPVASRAATVATHNVSAEGSKVLTQAGESIGLTIQEGRSPDAEVLVWHAGEKELDKEKMAELADYVREGGGLLVTIDQEGAGDAVRLSEVTPSSSWRATGPKARGPDEKVAVAEVDSEFFQSGDDLVGLELPWFYPLKPFFAEERGVHRYQRFAQNMIYLDSVVRQELDDFYPADHQFWTRPLLNRDWTVRMKGDDTHRSGLLITGRYGAGRVAIFGSAIDSTVGWPAAEAFWPPLLQWLATPSQAPAEALPTATAGEIALWQKEENGITATASVNPGGDSFFLTLDNQSAQAIDSELVARISSWQQALIGDSSGLIRLDAGATETYEIALPDVNYAEMDDLDAYDVRLALLSNDRTDIALEGRFFADLSPTASVTIRLPSIDEVDYPFPEVANITLGQRIGAHVNIYAAKPGSEVTAQLVVGNQLSNLAPMAQTKDETAEEDKMSARLNDFGARSGRNTAGQFSKIEASGSWQGTGGKDNVVTFTFPRAVTLSEVVLRGEGPYTKDAAQKSNPVAVSVEIDGKEVVSSSDLTGLFNADEGRAALSFPETTGTVVKLTFPWTQDEAPAVGEVELLGFIQALAAPSSGDLVWRLIDPMDDSVLQTGTESLTVEPGSVAEVSAQLQLPALAADSYFRPLALEASWNGTVSRVPLLVADPANPLLSVKSLKENSVELGFWQTSGMMHAFDVGTGTSEQFGGYATLPDSQIWAYSHKMMEIDSKQDIKPDRMYASENVFIFASNPWIDFPNGQFFYDVAAPGILESAKELKGWENADQMILSHSDRWGSGPMMKDQFVWQQLVAFDKYLRGLGKPGLTGQTKPEMIKEIEGTYENDWFTWNFDRYRRAIDVLKKTFEAEGKTVQIDSQGMPLLPAEFAPEFASVIKGASDDETWGMITNNVAKTTGRQAVLKALNPEFQWSTLLQWGWDSTGLSNQYFAATVGTTEPSRRHYYNRAWRGVIQGNGEYDGLHSYGYNSNGGPAFTLTGHDYQQWWNAKDRHSLIQPEAPFGAGFVLSTNPYLYPDRSYFTGRSMGDFEPLGLMKYALLYGNLAQSGIDVSFSANASAPGEPSRDRPLILVDLTTFADEEIALYKDYGEQGVPLLVFIGEGELSAAARDFLGIDEQGNAAEGSQMVGDFGGRQFVRNGAVLSVPGSIETIEPHLLAQAEELILNHLDQKIRFPEGMAGYGFTSGNQLFIVAEDWMDEAREVTIRLKMPTAPQAVLLNDHRAPEITHDGEYANITFQTRPGDGELICVQL